MLTGNAGNNGLYGGTQNDQLTGGDGNDTLNGGSNTDTMTGGNGDDSYYIDSLTDQAIETATTGTDQVFSTATWILGANFENLTLTGSIGAAATGNDQDNVITGNNSSNMLTGLGGNDQIMADDPTNTASGGDDTLDGGTGSNTLTGGLGDDTYIVTTGTDLIVEGTDAGIDTVRSDQSITLTVNLENLTLTGTALSGTGNARDNVLTGNAGANALQGDTGADTLIGDLGNDTLNGGTGVDSMLGGLGDDTYLVDVLTDKAIEGAAAGTDVVLTTTSYTIGANIENLNATTSNGVALTGNTQSNVVTGNVGADTVLGGSGNDSLIGGAGSDILNGETGVDTMAGGTEGDEYHVDSVFDRTVELLGQGTDLVISSVDWTLMDNTENLTLSGVTGLTGIGNGLANLIIGNTGGNVLNGLGGADDLRGGGGNDTLNGGDGADIMSGGVGNDLYLLDPTLDTIVELAGEGTDQIKSSVTYTLLDNFENLTLSGSVDLNGTGNGVANILSGNGAANQLTGLGGNDTIIAGDGADTLDGGTGVDSMAGGVGADTYLVDVAGDMVIETSARQIDSVLSLVTYTLGTNVENLTLQGININGTGNASSNTLIGSSGINVLTGLGGNDRLEGLDGNDTLNGGTGNDDMFGGNGDDLYVVNASRDDVSETGTGVDRVESSASFTLGLNLENLTLTGGNTINATGNSLANTIIGNTGANKIEGLAGNDILTGGGGADRFIFNSEAVGVDTITDFNGLVSGVAEGDKLVFEQSALVGSFVYVGAGDFSGGSNNTEARIQGSDLIIDLDGDEVGDITIQLTGLVDESQLTTLDFLFL